MRKQYPQGGTAKKQYIYAKCSKCGADKDPTNYVYCRTCANKHQLEYKRMKKKSIDEQLKILLRRKRKIERKTGAIFNSQELIKFMQPILNRNHWACLDDLINVMEYHNRLFNYEETFEITSVSKMWFDLCLLYKHFSIKNPC